MSLKKFSKFFLFVFSLILTCLTYYICHFLVEKYFFDQILYDKNSHYGYWYNNSPPHQLSLTDFGDRAKDIYDLETNYPNQSANKDNNIYKIAIYGDSYVWGQGIKNDQRFAKILENKLNKIRPTRVYSLAETTDNIFDDYQKFKLTPKIFGQMDLNIFGLVNNDLVFDNPIDNRYATKDYLESVKYFGCTGPEITDNLSLNNDQIDKVNLSFDPNSKNYCTYKKIISLFPKEKSLYFDLSAVTYMSIHSHEFKFVNLLSQDLPLFRPFSRDIISTSHPNRYNVSVLEDNPSALANQLYANVLYQEITNNPKWNFIQNDNQ